MARMMIIIVIVVDDGDGCDDDAIIHSADKQIQPPIFRKGLTTKQKQEMIEVGVMVVVLVMI